MATLDHPNLAFNQPRAGSWGSADREVITWDTSSFATADDIRLWKLPQGIIVDEVVLVVRDASNASTTLDVGYSDDDNYFMTVVTLNAQKRVNSLSETYHAPLHVTDNDWYLTADPAAQAISARTIVDFHVYYRNLGQ